jgi:glycosyltransferase involved in cell wall biosynthesis
MNFSRTTKILCMVQLLLTGLVWCYGLSEEPLWNKLKNKQPKTDKHFVIVIASYNNKDWYQKNLDSVFMQKYKKYHIIYVDDVSPDGTGDLVEKYIKDKHQEQRVTLIKNKERVGALANYYNAIHSCDDQSIIVQLDGDDWLAHDHVLDLLNKVYDNHKVWLTYGQFKTYPDLSIGGCKQIPANIIKTNDFRSYDWVTSHLRTFYAGLFKLIKKEDFLFEGRFFQMTGDLATMFPMLEMAGSRIKFVPDILHIYNRATPLNDNKVNVSLQLALDHFIRTKERYTLLEKKDFNAKYD